MSFVNPGKYTHASRGYAIVKECDRNGHYTKKYKVVENDTYGCCWEVPPLFQNRHKQVCIELCNFINSHDYSAGNWPTHIETEHFIFDGKQSGCSLYYEITAKDSFAELAALGLVEILHRKNSLIKKLKREFLDARYDAIKYKKMLFDYHAKMNAKMDYEIEREIEETIYGKKGMPDISRQEILIKAKEEMKK